MAFAGLLPPPKRSIKLVIEVDLIIYSYLYVVIIILLLKTAYNCATIYIRICLNILLMCMQHG